MDNLSHSVVGLATGEFLHRSLPEESTSERQSLRRRLLLLSCWLASNFPDLDLFFTSLLPPPLGYLLHHRGHTHTLLYALPQALLIAVLVWLLWPAARRLMKDSAAARRGFALCIAIGLALHLMMDYLNPYGIHPFHPFDSRWLYGDMVFILEPAFWISFGVPMAMMVSSRALRMLLLALLLGAPVYFTMRGFLAWSSLAALALAAAVLAAAQLRAGISSRGALFLSFCMITGFIAIQALASAEGRRVVAEEISHRDGNSRLLDVAMSAFPGNPFCWNFASVESNEGAGIYRLRRGILSVAPHTVPVSACPASLSGGDLQGATAIAMTQEHQGSLQALRGLRDANCHFDAWMRFARVPAVDDSQATDIRFSGGMGANFTTMRFDEFSRRACPAHVPQWDYPRADLLRR
jgi:inner membrane protein